MKPFKILQDRSKTNVFVSDCEEEEKHKTKLRFFWEQSEKNRPNIIVPQLSKICHCYSGRRWVLHSCRIFTLTLTLDDIGEWGWGWVCMVCGVTNDDVKSMYEYE